MGCDAYTLALVYAFDEYEVVSREERIDDPWGGDNVCRGTNTQSETDRQHTIRQARNHGVRVWKSDRSIVTQVTSIDRSTGTYWCRSPICRPVTRWTGIDSIQTIPARVVRPHRVLATFVGKVMIVRLFFLMSGRAHRLVAIRVGSCVVQGMIGLLTPLKVKAQLGKRYQLAVRQRANG